MMFHQVLHMKNLKVSQWHNAMGDIEGLYKDNEQIKEFKILEKNEDAT